MRAKDFLIEGYRQAINKFIEAGETEEKTKDVVRRFKTLVDKNQIKSLNEKNIDWWANKPLSELEQFIQNKSVATKTQLKRSKLPGKSMTIMDNDEWLVVVPLDKDASCFHGKNTDWCTSKRDRDNFEHYFYRKKVTLIYCINKQTGGKWAIAASPYGLEFFDDMDNPISPYAFDGDTGLSFKDLVKQAVYFNDEKVEAERQAIQTDPAAQLTVIKNTDGTAIKWIEKPTKEAQLLTLKIDPSLFGYIKNPDPEAKEYFEKYYGGKLNEDRKLGPSLVSQGYVLSKVKIYRAVLATIDTFKPMDYVTRSLKFAKEHADHVQAVEGEAAHVIEMIAKATDVYEAYNPGEYFYNGPETKGNVIYKPELDESWSKTLATAAMAGGLALGGNALMKQQTPTQPPAQQIQAEPEPEKVNPSIRPTNKPAIPEVVRQVQSGLKTPLAQALIKEAQSAGMHGIELAQFLAQCAHETNNFRRLKEYGGSLDFKKYDIKHNPQIAKLLGNTHPGDGLKYIGRGFIQLTGKENYKRAQKALGIPVADNPHLVEKPDIAAKIAVWFWQHRVAPRIDNFSDTAAVTKPINSRLSGLDDREQKFKAIAELTGLEI